MHSFYTRYLIAPSVMLLVVAFGVGHWNNFSPAGTMTRTALLAVQSFCPSPIGELPARSTVADGAHAIDRAMWRVIRKEVLGPGAAGDIGSGAANTTYRRKMRCATEPGCVGAAARGAAGTAGRGEEIDGLEP